VSYKTIKKYNTMKRTTLILLALFAWVWQTNAQYLTEGFEGGTFPPTGWTLNQTNTNKTWVSYTGDVQEGTTAASCEYDDSLGAQDELLLSPVIDLTSASGPINLSFWFYMSYYWSVDPYDNYDLKVQATTDGGATFTDLWSEADYGTFTNWTWYNAMVDLSAYAGTNNLQIGFRYVGTDGAQAIIDNISIVDTTPEATFTANPDCANGQFSVDVNVTDFHGATSVTVSDDQGSTSQQLSAPGTVSFGPYASGTTVHYTVVNDQNNVTLSQDLGYSCPPENDACADATPIETLPYNITEDATSDTNNDGFIDVCASNGMNDGVWFTFTPSNAGTVDITATPNGWDNELQVYSGADCGNLSCEGHIDDGLAGDAESLSISVTAGTKYWINTGYWSGSTDGAEGPFDLSVTSTDVTLVSSVEDNQIAGFKFYPNPVNHTLNLSAQNNIENVNIFNVTGQQVISVKPEATQTQIDMSKLQNGIYFVKAQINGEMTAFKVVKK